MRYVAPNGQGKERFDIVARWGVGGSLADNSHIFSFTIMGVLIRRRATQSVQKVGLCFVISGDDDFLGLGRRNGADSMSKVCCCLRYLLARLGLHV